ncbi:paeninodin family lasso peptide [Paenibacillus roseipurpureus]|uniref:Paeninodin family lasso peptide n=1 Tax=Paenibacillus roseopurpureus TaxID=2918901 RepID=A0AA96LNJ5_9BACL|nr:paeninodin family lasso peptide [Paenibacillus sp. MBLB1832]WNR43811.1 paeninodin family lasso peptide [Paenibacillus sp. MBLB1832]
MQKNWQKPELETLDVGMTMAGEGGNDVDGFYIDCHFPFLHLTHDS